MVLNLKCAETVISHNSKIQVTIEILVLSENCVVRRLLKLE